MRALSGVLLFFVFCGISPGQGAKEQAPMRGPEEVIQRIIVSGMIEGHDSKILGRLGDAAAVMVTKVAAEERPSPPQIDSILVVLTESFADPSMVPVLADRKPRTTLICVATS